MYYEEWNQPVGKKEKTETDLEEQKRLMFGLIFSLKQFIQKTSRVPPVEGLRCYRTDGYMCHHFETATGLKFILTTDPAVENLNETLKYIYANLFVEYVVKNPLYRIQDRLHFKSFSSHLNQYIESLACFRSAAAAP